MAKPFCGDASLPSDCSAQQAENACSVGGIGFKKKKKKDEHGDTGATAGLAFTPLL